MRTIHQKNYKHSIILTGAAAALLLLMLAALSIGSSGISLRQMATSLIGDNESAVQQIIFKIRFPRVWAAVLAGAALSVSGAVIQTVIRNPLGSPYTLGLSASSMFGAALAIVTLGYMAQRGIAHNLQHIPYIVTASAFAFGLLCALLITGFARWRSATPETLVMAGIILSALFGSATSLMQYVSNDVELAAIVSWMFGDLGKATTQNTWLVLLVVLPSIAYFLTNTFNLSTLNAGDDIATSLGVKVNQLRMITVIVASLVTAVTVAFYGVIAFVGLIIPHVTRKLLGFNERPVIIGSALFGAIFLLASDMLARTLLAPVVIPVGIITSFVGAPFFLYLLFNRIKKR